MSEPRIINPISHPDEQHEDEPKLMKPTRRKWRIQREYWLTGILTGMVIGLSIISFILWMRSSTSEVSLNSVEVNAVPDQKFDPLAIPMADPNAPATDSNLLAHQVDPTASVSDMAAQDVPVLTPVETASMADQLPPSSSASAAMMPNKPNRGAAGQVLPPTSMTTITPESSAQARLAAARILSAQANAVMPSAASNNTLATNNTMQYPPVSGVGANTKFNTASVNAPPARENSPFEGYRPAPVPVTVYPPPRPSPEPAPISAPPAKRVSASEAAPRLAKIRELCTSGDRGLAQTAWEALVDEDPTWNNSDERPECVKRIGYSQ